MESANEQRDFIKDTELERKFLKQISLYWLTFGHPGVVLASHRDRLGCSNIQDRLKVVKMEVDPNPATVKQYQVEGVPALLVQGTEVLASLGAIGKQNWSASRYSLT